MDVFTHFALPYLLVLALRRRQVEALAAGIGGYAPDIDILTAPLAALVPQLYFLGHRGVSHTIIGAPLHALALVGILALPWWARRWPRFEKLRFPVHAVPIAMIFSYTHLLLDFLTHWGVVAMWPWSFQRFTASWFFYSVSWAIPLGAWLAWRVWTERADERFLRRIAVALVVVYLVAGGVRAATFPGAPEDGVAQPLALDWRWATLAPHGESGWEATFWAWGAPTGNASYQSAPPATPEAEDALARAKETDLYRRFLMYAGGPNIERVEMGENAGMWNVTFVDLMSRVQVDASSGFFARFGDDRGMLKLVVDADGVRERG